MSHNTEAANRVVGKRVIENTKAGYRGKIRNIYKFLESNHRRWIRNINSTSEIKLPLNLEILKVLFGWLSTNTDLPKKKKKKSEEDSDDDSDSESDNDDGETCFADNEITISHSCMQGYKSALVWYYSEKGLTMASNLNEWCDRL